MNKLIPVYVRVPAIFFTVFAAMEFFIDSGDRPAFIKYPIVLLFLFLVLFLIIAIEICMSAIENVSYLLLSEEQKKELENKKPARLQDMKWYQKIRGFFIKTRSVDEEGALLMDHDYDGIKELDNDLPPWWVYLFYGCIAFALIYMVRFHVFGGENQMQEFEREMADAKIAVEEYKKTAKDLIDEKTVVLLTDPKDLADGKALFENNCAVCHRADGGGAIGPNLTDDHWLLGGGIKNVFHTITNGGRDGKGMVAWKGTLKPSEIQLVASYVLSLQGSKPVDGKAPDGELWTEAEAGNDTKAEIAAEK